MSSTAIEDSIQLLFFNQVCLVQLPALLTVNQAVAMRQQMQSICEMSPLPARIVLDFGRTTFVDSSGIGALVSLLKMAQSRSIELSCWSFSPQVKMMLSLTNLDQMFVEVKGTAGLIPTQAVDTAPQPDLTHPSVHSRLKRLIDIAGALLGLGITGLLFVPIAVAIKLDSPGPILYSQIRCSWMGKRFRIWKFRSMVVNAETLKHKVENQAGGGAFFKNAKDPRVTKVGRFLRKTSLDEFPQFWNVLKGDMSLVGTRPPTVDELDHYEIPQWQRLNVKPGLTGEWQVNGRSKVLNFEDVVRLDLQYQQNWSLRYDLRLILKTIAVIFSKRSGAV